MSYAPIAGNAAFSRVRDMAGQVATVNAAEVKAASVSATKVSSALPALAPSFAAAPYGKTLVELELRTPGSGVAAAEVTLVRLDGTAYVVPVGGINVVSATLLGSSDLAGGGDTDLGKSGGGATVLLNNTPAASLVAGGGVSVSGLATTLAFASTGVPAVVNIAAGLSITVTVATTAYSAGSLRARLVYYV